MKDGNSASDLVGFPYGHSAIFLKIACERDEIIMAREVGIQCTGLIEEGYGLKGFRIDTKSCDWGPMAGFVCMDPRLNKAGRKKEEFNRTQTRHAITGEVTNLGGVELDTRQAVVRGESRTTEWAASVKPIVISETRVSWLEKQRLIHVSAEQRDGTGRSSLVGVSLFPCSNHEKVDARPGGNNCKDCIQLHWRLIALTDADLKAISSGGAPCSDKTYYGLFADGDCLNPFVQEYSNNVERFSYQDPKGKHEPLLGLINPGTEAYGFKACVTGDYDLFAVWPRETDFSQEQYASLGETFHGRQGRRFGKDERQLGPALVWADLARFQRAERGNVTPRINEIISELNGGLGPVFGNPGDLVHHSDEVGNPGGLAKPLSECLPIIAFLPPSPSAVSAKYNVQAGGILGLENTDDLREFAREVQSASFHLDLKPHWWRELDLTPPSTNDTAADYRRALKPSTRYPSDWPSDCAR